MHFLCAYFLLSLLTFKLEALQSPENSQYIFIVVRSFADSKNGKTGEQLHMPNRYTIQSEFGFTVYVKRFMGFLQYIKNKYNISRVLTYTIRLGDLSIQIGRVGFRH